MTTHLKTALAATAAAAVTLGVTPGVAHADDSAITVRWAQTASDNNGKFQVSLSSTSPITSISATLRSYATGQAAAPVTKFELVSGTDQAGQWEPTARVKLPALGSYHIDLSVADQAGDTLTATDAGIFYYMVQTLFRGVTVDRHSVDIDHQQVRIAGTFLGREPGTGAVSPLAGYPLYILNNYWQDTDLTSAADGTFSAVETVTEQGPLQVSYPYDNGHLFYSSSGSAEFPIKLVSSPTRIVEHLSATRIPYGGTISASGTLQWKAASGWQPLAGKTVGADGCGIQGSTTTDADGDFSFPAGPSLQGLDCTLTTGWQSDDPFKKDAAAAPKATIVQPVSFLDFAAARTDAGDVTVEGHLAFPGSGTPWPVPADVQFSANGKSGWTTVDSGVTAEWDGTGYGFGATVPSTTAGYWRATFTGGKQFANATSTVAYAPAG
jgi:hypothetical protein